MEKRSEWFFFNFRQPPNTLHIHSSDRERTWPEAHCHICDCRAFSTMLELSLAVFLLGSFGVWLALLASNDVDLSRRTRVFCMLEGQGSLESVTRMLIAHLHTENDIGIILRQINVSRSTWKRNWRKTQCPQLPIGNPQLKIGRPVQIEPGTLITQVHWKGWRFAGRAKYLSHSSFRTVFFFLGGGGGGSRDQLWERFLQDLIYPHFVTCLAKSQMSSFTTGCYLFIQTSLQPYGTWIGEPSKTRNSITYDVIVNMKCWLLIC